MRNFDTFTGGLLTLTEVATLEEWVAVLNSVRRAPAQFGEQPASNPSDAPMNHLAIAFFIIFVIVANLLLLNLFGGGVYSRFKTLKDEKQMGVMTEDQLQYVESIRLLTIARPRRASGRPKVAWSIRNIRVH